MSIAEPPNAPAGASPAVPLPADPASPLELDRVVSDEAWLARIVDEAVLGDLYDDAPEATPGRELRGVADFVSVYVRYRYALQRHARRYLSEANDVDDVVQDAFLKLFLAMPEITSENHAVAFCRRTITNACIDRFRATGRRPRLVDLEAVNPDDLLADDEPIDPVLRAEDAAIVRQALAALPPLYRAALVKREIEEKSLPVIAAELDVPDESVKHLLFRARRALRRLLTGTAVDPSARLADDLSVVARRAGAALAHNAQYVLIVVLALAAVAWHPWSRNQHHSVLGDAGRPALSVPPAAPTSGGTASTGRTSAPNAPAHGLTPTDTGQASSHGAGNPAVPVTSPGSNAGTNTGSTSGSTTGSPLPAGSYPVAPPPVSPPSGGGSPTPTPPGSPTPPPSSPVPPTTQQLAMTSPYTPTGDPKLTDQTTVPPTDGQPAVLTNTFVAPTTQGIFALHQNIVQAPGSDGTDAATLHVSARLPSGGNNVAAVTLGAVSDATTLPGGGLRLSGLLSVTRSRFDTPAVIRVTVVTDPHLTGVVSEQVTVMDPAADSTSTPAPTGSPDGSSVDPSDGPQSPPPATTVTGD